MFREHVVLDVAVREFCLVAQNGYVALVCAHCTKAMSGVPHPIFTT